MINLSNTPIIQSYQTADYQEEAKIIAINGVNVSNDNNIEDIINGAINSSQTSITTTATWTGYVGYAVIEDEIIYVSSASGTTLTVLRGQMQTVATSHLSGVEIYTVTIFEGVTSYQYDDKLGLDDRDLFKVDIGNCVITLDSKASDWNKVSGLNIYSFRKNKKVAIFEGCNKQVIKTYEGITFEKIGSSAEYKVTIQANNQLNKWIDKPLSMTKLYDDIRPKELLEDLFTGYTATYVNNTTDTDYFKLYNISTSEFSTYREFLNYLCKEYGIWIIFRKNKTIHITSIIEPTKITPTISVETELTKINDDDSNNIIINKVTGTWKERQTQYREDDFKIGSAIQYVNFKMSKAFSSPMTIPIITFNSDLNQNVFNEITFTGLTSDEVSTMQINDYCMIQQTNTPLNQYMGKFTDISFVSANNYTVKLVVGYYDKASAWNSLGRIDLEGLVTWTNQLVTLKWVFTELPIVWKFGKKIANEDRFSNVRWGLIPNNEEVIYIDKFGVNDEGTSKFSGLVKNIEGLKTGTWLTNSDFSYNKELSQNGTDKPIYVYSNKISSTHPNADKEICIGSIDNSNLQIKFEDSDVKGSQYKVTIKNTLTPNSTLMTPTKTYDGQVLLELSLTNYNATNIGDLLVINPVTSSDSKYKTYLNWQNERWLVETKFTSGGQCFITVNTPFPKAYNGVTEWEVIKHPRNTVILLNELYIRGNPIMETENSYEYINQPSIDEYGEKEYEIVGKSLLQNDFARLCGFFKDSFGGISNVMNKVRFSLTKRLDIEVGDCIYVTDKVQTGFNNQKCLITRKSVTCDNEGIRNEEYEGLTFGDYTATSVNVVLKSTLEWKPVGIPTYSHRGELDDTNTTSSEVDNPRASLVDDTEGTIYVQEIAIVNFSGKSSLTSTIANNVNSFNMNINNMSGTQITVWQKSLLRLGAEGILKINGEYMIYKSLADVSGGIAQIQVLKRGVSNTSAQTISDGLRVQFYKILAKSGANGIASTNAKFGDGVDNFVLVDEINGIQMKGNGSGATAGTSYINLNNGYQQIGKITGITDYDGTTPKTDFYGYYFGNPNLSARQYTYYNNLTGILAFEGKYNNKTAYCSDSYDLAGALDSTKSTITINSVTQNNPFYGMIVNTIILTKAQTYDLSLLSSSHFGFNNIKPSDDVMLVTSMYGAETTIIKAQNFDLFLVYPIKFSDVTFDYLGVTTLSPPEAITIASHGVIFENIRFTNLNGRIFGGFYVEQSWKNIIIKSYTSSSTVNFGALIAGCINMDYITLSINSNFQFNTCYFFGDCTFLNKILLISSSITYYNVNIFNGCSYINEVNSTSAPSGYTYRSMAVNCTNISNVYISQGNALAGNGDFIFNNCSHASNITIYPSTYNLKHFKNCSYLSNIDSGIDNSQNTGNTYVDNKTVSWNSFGYVQNTDVTVANTTSLTIFTNETGARGTTAVPANYFTVGKMFRVKLMGYVSTLNNSQQSRVRIYIGASETANAAYIETSYATLPNGASYEVFDMEFNITIRSVGGIGTASARVEGRTLFHSSSGISNAQMREIVATNAITGFDSTALNYIGVAYQWQTANASNSITCTHFTIEEI